MTQSQPTSSPEPSPHSPTQPNPTLISADPILQQARSLGFIQAGITPARPTARPDFFHQWLAAKHHGQMHYLANHVQKRLDPKKLLPGARSIICVADLYHPPTPHHTPTPPHTPPRHTNPDHTTTSQNHNPQPQSLGRFARYAHGNDYHLVIKKRLHHLANQLADRYPTHHFKTTVDTAPILEREHAQHAGLGWIGKHTLLIHPSFGSWMLLGQIVTTLPITPTDAFTTDHCGTCTRCIDACPTQSITPDGYALNAERCISYLTLEHRTRIDPDLHQPIGNWIGGCDICQDVCPHNRTTKTNSAPLLPDYFPRKTIANGIPTFDILNWSAENRSQIFSQSSLKRIKLDMLKRNALIAAGNFLAYKNDATLQQRINSIAHDDNELALVRQTALDVIKRLMSSPDTTDTHA